ncbi:MAG: tryptophan-rich sensory protein [Oscillospiraceae bacterium]|nr:tryptophan-rich sensory protein [Oscillospiraceae bacterium]
MNKKVKTYLTFILIPLVVGGLSAFFTRNSMNIFDTVAKPPLAPPAIAFPIVWSILYVLMGIGAARVYLKNPQSDAIPVFGINLFFNFFWSIIFFNMRAFCFAFVWLLVLLAVVLAMTVKFYRVDKLAGILQIPYVIWLLIAGYLNLFICLAN